MSFGNSQIAFSSGSQLKTTPQGPSPSGPFPGFAVSLSPSGDQSGTADTANIAAAATIGSSVFLSAGQWYITSLALTAILRAEIAGAGKGITFLNYVGNGGVALQIGPNYPTTIAPNARIKLRDFTLVGNNTGAVGLRLSRIQTFRMESVESMSFTGVGGIAVDFHACNSGVCIDCDARLSTTGHNYAVDADNNGAALITHHGGQVTGNGAAIAAGNSQSARIKYVGTNIASNTTSPAVLLSHATGWELDAFFENNAAGACVVQLGDAANYAVGCKVNSYWSETAALTYLVQVVRGITNNIADNYFGGTAPGTACIRAEANSTGLNHGPNANQSGGTLLSDVGVTTTAIGTG